MNHEETTISWRLLQVLNAINVSFIAFKTLNSTNSSASSVAGLILVLNGSLNIFEHSKFRR